MLAKVLAESAYDGYHETLGEFIAGFATVETEMQKLLRRYAGVDEAVAKAIFSGVRAETGMSFIRRLSEAKGASSAAKEDLTDVFAQLGAINKLRNVVLHYGTDFDEGGNLIATNALVAHSADSLQTHPISARILTDLCFDLHKITLHLRYHDLPALPLDMANGINAVRKASWRYRPPQQGSSRQGNQPKQGKPQRQPKSSPP